MGRGGTQCANVNVSFDSKPEAESNRIEFGDSPRAGLAECDTEMEVDGRKRNGSCRGVVGRLDV